MNPADFPPGTIGLPSGDMSRYAQYTYCLANLNKPPGSVVQMMRSVSVPLNLNTIISRMEGDWLWLMGDDHVFEPNLLLKLLARDVDVIAPLCMRRYPPLQPVVYKPPTIGADGLRRYEPYSFGEIPRTGIFEVEACGTAGMLIQRYVLDAVGYPWFASTSDGEPNEDVEFCFKVRVEGYPIHVDVDNRLGHLGTVTYLPIPDVSKETGWGFVVDMGGMPGDGLRSISVWPERREVDENG